MKLQEALSICSEAYCGVFDPDGVLRAFTIVKRGQSLDGIADRFLESDMWKPGEPSEHEWDQTNWPPPVPFPFYYPGALK